MTVKHLLSLIFYLTLHIGTYAQVKNNRWVFGGDVAFSSSGSATYLGAAPEVGYFLTPDLETGGSLGYTYITNGNIRRNLWSIGPHINYFFSDSFFLRAKLQHLTGKETITGLPGFTINESSLWLGGGYQTNANGVFYRVGLLYNTLYRKNTSIYNSPVLPYASLGYRL